MTIYGVFRGRNPSLRMRSSLKSVFLGLTLCISACDSDQQLSEFPDDNRVHLDQGWTPEITGKIHHTSFGSRLIPLPWMLNLVTAEGEAILSNANITSMGFIDEPKSALNPHGLPVGFTIDKDKQGTEWAGLGCAACHTGEVEYQGKKIRLEGGQGLVNFTLFEETVASAIESTLSSAQKLAAFELAISSDEAQRADLVAQMEARLSYLRSRQKINKTPVDYGYGRLDAFGQIFNTVGAELLDRPENALVPDAPVSYPVLWNASHLDLVQWNGSAPNAGPGPLFQNVTTAIAVYGQMKIVGNDQKLGYSSSVNIPNLKKIQNWLYSLKSPKWPEDILGKLDPQKLAAGEEVYQQNCLQCHQLVDDKQSNYKLKAALTPISEIGTDPKMVENFLNAKVDSGVLEGKKVLWLAGDKIGKQEKSINLVAHAAAGAALNHPLQTLDAIIEDYHSVYKATLNQNPNYYKARPLTGIWSAAPYLHNGSVLTLSELLSPVSQRRQTFYVGDRNLDLEKVGLISSQGKNRSLFDTSLPGNSNAGHLYGVSLTSEEKSSLIEYLKSL